MEHWLSTNTTASIKTPSLEELAALTEKFREQTAKQIAQLDKILDEGICPVCGKKPKRLNDGIGDFIGICVHLYEEYKKLDAAPEYSPTFWLSSFCGLRIRIVDSLLESHTQEPK